METSKFIQLVATELESKVKEYGFSLTKVVVKSEKRMEFVNKEGGFTFHFSVFFGKKSCDAFVHSRHKEFDQIFKYVYKEYAKNCYTASTRLDYYCSQKNKDGYFRSNDGVEIPLKMGDSDSIPDLIYGIYQIYFIGGVQRFMANTNSISKLDSLVNDIPIFEREKGRRNLHFGNIPHEAAIGLLSAKLNKNSKLPYLLEGYSKRIAQSNPDFPFTKLFFKVSDFIQEV